MIIFQNIKWKNFLSTGNDFTEIKIQNSGVTLIVGENGAGKSTFLDAITFALFGKAFRNINKPQLINTITKKEMVVELNFEIGSKKYKVIRGLRPSIFEIYVNNVLLNQAAETKDYQEILEKQILKTNYKTFCQVDILGSASFIPFMQLPAAARRSVIEDLLDLQIFSNMNVHLKEMAQENNTNITEAEYKKKLTKERIRLTKSHIEEIVKNNKIVIDQKKQAIEDYKQNNRDIENSINEKNNQIIEIENKYSIGKLSKYQEILKEGNGYKIKFENKKTLLENEITFLNTHENCPTCKQNINKEFRCDSVDTKEKEIQKINETITEINDKIEEVSQKINSINEALTIINQIKTDVAASKAIINVNLQNINKIKLELETQFSIGDNNSKEKIFEFEKELTSIENSIKLLLEDKQVMSVALSLLKDGGIKTKIINQYIPIINKYINKYLSAMDFFVDFQLDSQFNETIKSRFRDEFSYSSFSEGEKQRIDLALLFTWRAVSKLRNSMSTNLLILDEIFDSSLDSNSTEMLMQILNIIGSDCSLFVISHKEHLIEKFTNIIKFEKYKNFSRIAE